jgi:hypothetical protein
MQRYHYNAMTLLVPTSDFTTQHFCGKSLKNGGLPKETFLTQRYQDTTESKFKFKFK